MSSFAMPKWSRELLRFLPAKAQFVLWGNIRDVYPLEVDRTVTTLKLDAYLTAVLRQQGYTLIVKYEPLIGFTLLAGDADTLKQTAGLSCRDGAIAQATLPAAAQALEKLVTAKGLHCAALVDFASRIPDLCSAGNDVNAFFYHLFRLMHSVIPKLTQPASASDSAGKLDTAKAADAPLYSPIIWLLDKENDLPSWYALNSARLRNLPVPKPDHEIRRSVALTLVPRMAGFADMPEERQEEQLQLFVTQTTGLLASELVAVVQLARREGLRFGDIGEAIRRYKLGVPENLWAKLDRNRIREAESLLSQSVMGQDRAVRHVANVLKRSVFSLSGTQFSRSAQRPKGVLFFAGPTGVGKTELARALTELVFGSPTHCIRFDMSEFGREHADQRLVGAPPGYVGYDVGGELTNAVKQNPFSVLLFDEVEKAHPRILDIFLQILDEGRLTSGRGETVYFSESLIVFTSNLGVYEQLPDGTRRQRVTPDMPWHEAEARIREAIDDFFRYTINRPEILNRIGKNIVVFDSIRRPTAERIFDKMLNNLQFRLQDTHGITLILNESARGQALEEICRDLSMGGRGVGNSLEEVLVNPLSRALFEQEIPPGTTLTVTELVQGKQGWELEVHV